MMTLTEYRECEEAMTWLGLHMAGSSKRDRFTAFVNRLIVAGWSVNSATLAATRWID